MGASAAASEAIMRKRTTSALDTLMVVCMLQFRLKFSSSLVGDLRMRTTFAKRETEHDDERPKASYVIRRALLGRFKKSSESSRGLPMTDDR
jgi:hypothetical protein